MEPTEVESRKANRPYTVRSRDSGLPSRDAGITQAQGSTSRVESSPAHNGNPRSNQLPQSPLPTSQEERARPLSRRSSFSARPPVITQQYAQPPPSARYSGFNRPPIDVKSPQDNYYESSDSDSSYYEEDDSMERQLPSPHALRPREQWSPRPRRATSTDMPRTFDLSHIPVSPRAYTSTSGPRPQYIQASTHPASHLNPHNAPPSPQPSSIIVGSRRNKRRQSYYGREDDRVGRPREQIYQQRNSYARRYPDYFEPTTRAKHTDLGDAAQREGEIRLRVDASAPLSIQLHGDSEGRTLQIDPAENGMADIVIGSDNTSGKPGEASLKANSRATRVERKSNSGKQQVRSPEPKSVRFMEPRWPSSSLASGQSSRPQAHRRPSISRVEECNDPNCTECMGSGIPRPLTSDSLRQGRVVARPHDARSSRSDPTSDRLPIVQIHRRPSSASRRPMSYHGASDYWTSPMVPPYPNITPEYGPPPSMSAHYAPSAPHFYDARSGPYSMNAAPPPQDNPFYRPQDYQHPPATAQRHGILPQDLRDAARSSTTMTACSNCKKRREKCDLETPCKSCLKYYGEDLVNHPCTRQGNRQNQAARRTDAITKLSDAEKMALEAAEARAIHEAEASFESKTENRKTNKAKAAFGLKTEVEEAEFKAMQEALVRVKNEETEGRNEAEPKVKRTGKAESKKQAKLREMKGAVPKAPKTKEEKANLEEERNTPSEKNSDAQKYTREPDLKSVKPPLISSPGKGKAKLEARDPKDLEHLVQQVMRELPARVAETKAREAHDTKLAVVRTSSETQDLQESPKKVEKTTTDPSMPLREELPSIDPSLPSAPFAAETQRGNSSGAAGWVDAANESGDSSASPSVRSLSPSRPRQKRFRSARDTSEAEPTVTMPEMDLLLMGTVDNQGKPSIVDVHPAADVTRSIDPEQAQVNSDASLSTEVEARISNDDSKHEETPEVCYTSDKATETCLEAPEENQIPGEGDFPEVGTDNAPEQRVRIPEVQERAKEEAAQILETGQESMQQHVPPAGDSPGRSSTASSALPQASSASVQHATYVKERWDENADALVRLQTDVDEFGEPFLHPMAARNDPPNTNKVEKDSSLSTQRLPREEEDPTSSRKRTEEPSVDPGANTGASIPTSNTERSADKPLEGTVKNFDLWFRSPLDETYKNLTQVSSAKDDPKIPFTASPPPQHKEIPSGARWTKIDRRLVNPQALDEAEERYEERPDCVIVLRVLTKDEIQMLANRTSEIRKAEAEAVEEEVAESGAQAKHKDTAKADIDRAETSVAEGKMFST